MSETKFIQLGERDCTYLLELIEDLDGQTPYTARQRGYTAPKLERIKKDPFSSRLAPQDVEYLLDLVEDDELGPVEEKERVFILLSEIRSLQQKKALEVRAIEEQRELRKALRTKR